MSKNPWVGKPEYGSWTGVPLKTLPPGKRYITIWLSDRVSGHLKDCRCMNCGSLLFRYRSRIDVIFDGRVPELSRPVEFMCRNCGCLYQLGE